MQQRSKVRSAAAETQLISGATICIVFTTRGGGRLHGARREGRKPEGVYTSDGVLFKIPGPASSEAGKSVASRLGHRSYSCNAGQGGHQYFTTEWGGVK